MIGQIKGTVAEASERFCIVDVGGIGYKIFATFEAIREAKMASTATFWTHLAVREDALDLYGFTNRVDLHFFELLLTVSGIGPKSALTILNVASAETIRTAVRSADTSYLTKVSGIGRKTAEKIVHELKEKVGAAAETGDGAPARDEVDALEALKVLGYSRDEAREALQKVAKDAVGPAERVKAALKELGK